MNAKCCNIGSGYLTEQSDSFRNMICVISILPGSFGEKEHPYNEYNTKEALYTKRHSPSDKEVATHQPSDKTSLQENKKKRLNEGTCILIVG